MRRRIVGTVILALCAAARAMGAEPDAAAEVRLLAAKLGSASFDERDRAYARLLDLGVGDAAGVLAALPKDDPDPEARVRLASLRVRIPCERERREALRLAGDDARLAGAIDRLFFGLSDEGVQEVIQALGEGRKGEAAALLSRFLDHPDREFRVRLLQSLAALADPAAAPRVAKLLSDDDPGARSTAAYALGEMQDPAYAPEIRRLLADPLPNVRCAALAALARLKDRPAAPQVLRMLSDAEPAVRANALHYLGETADPEHAPRIRPFLKEPDWIVSSSAAWALAALGDRESIPAIAALMESGGGPLQERAAGALLYCTRVKHPTSVRTVDAARAWWAKNRASFEKPPE